MVRLTAWLSFVVGQLAIPWLLIPLVCGVLVYLQARLGMWKPVAIASTALGGVLALVQAVMAMRLLPLGVKLLMRDASVCEHAGARARFAAFVSFAVLGAAGALDWATANMPRLVHPWLGTVLEWAVLRPEMIYGGVCLIHALVLAQCVRAAKT